MKILNKDRITSLELLEQINLFRKQEGRRKTTHKDLLIIIETELIGINRKRIEGGVCPEMQKQIETELNKIGIDILPYTNKQNRQSYQMYNLTYKQAVQVLVKESRFVRKSVINYIEHLETRVKQLERKKGKVIRKLETDAIKTLLEYGKVPKNKHSRYYTNYSRLPYVVLGIDKVDRDVLPAYDLEQIKEMETIIQLTIYKSIMELKPIKEIYNICKNKLINSLVQN